VAGTIHSIRGSVHPVGVTGVVVGMGAVGAHTIRSICIVAVSPDTALKAQKRWGCTGRLTTRWEQVVIDVLDENSLSLLHGKHSIKQERFYPASRVLSSPGIRSMCPFYSAEGDQITERLI
jgi:hypothetical protein